MRNKINTTAKKLDRRALLNRIVDALFAASPREMSTVEIARAVGVNPGTAGATLARHAWATRRRRIRVDRNTVRTSWSVSDAGLIDYARRHAGCIARRAAKLAAKGIVIEADAGGRVRLRCGSVTAVVHTD